MATPGARTTSALRGRLKASVTGTPAHDVVPGSHDVATPTMWAYTNDTASPTEGTAAGATATGALFNGDCTFKMRLGVADASACDDNAENSPNGVNRRRRHAAQSRQHRRNPIGRHTLATLAHKRVWAHAQRQDVGGEVAWQCNNATASGVVGGWGSAFQDATSRGWNRKAGEKNDGHATHKRTSTAACSKTTTAAATETS